MKFRVREICKEKGVTMEKIALELGITPNTLTRNINGNPTIETLEKVANTLGVPMVELFEAPKSDTIACPNCGAELILKKK
jgi:transcriptional regulator with XRE-family HTH domain